MANFTDLVKEHGSVSSALASLGYSKGSDGSWSKGSSSGSASSTSKGNSGSSSNGNTGSSSNKTTGSTTSKGTASSGYYNPDLDYSLAIKNAQTSGASQSYINQLQQERQNKIDARYGGVDPYKGNSNIMGSGSSTSSGINWPTGQTHGSGSNYNGDNRTLNAQGYDPTLDYSLAIRNEKDPQKLAQLQQERQNKINAQYGGVDPYLQSTVNQSTGKVTTPANTASKYYGSTWTPQTATVESNSAYRTQQDAASQAYASYLAQQVAQGKLSKRDADLAWAKAGGVVNYDDGTPAWWLNQQGYNASVDMSDAALEKAYASGNYDAADELINQRKLYAAANGLSYDAVLDWYNLSQKYQSPWTGKTLEEMYAGNRKAYGTGQNGVSVENTVNPNTGADSQLGVTPGTSTGVSGTGSFKDYLDQWLEAAQQQQTNQIDWGTSQAVNELVRAQQDAEAQFQAQRNEIAIDEARAKDNQALYAEARGDKGGIGAAQYDSIMNTAAQNRLTVNSAQTKLATDTARQIADLRAQGEYEKADALLTLSQNYLSQLISLEQWSMEYNLSVAQFNASLEQWAKEYELQLADLMGSYNGTPTLSAQQFAFNQQQYNDELQAVKDQQLASAGETLLSAGILPSESQLAAMGITKSQAQSYITALKMSGSSGSSSGSRGSSTPASEAEASMDYEGLFQAASNSGNPKSWLAQSANYKKYGFTSSSGLYDDYQNWLSERGYDGVASDLDELKANGITNRTKLHEVILSALHNGYVTLAEAQRLASNYLGSADML